MTDFTLLTRFTETLSAWIFLIRYQEVCKDGCLFWTKPCRINCLENRKERLRKNKNPAPVILNGKRKKMSTRQKSGRQYLGEGQQEKYSLPRFQEQNTALHKRSKCVHCLKSFFLPNGFFLLTKCFNVDKLYKHCIHLSAEPKQHYCGCRTSNIWWGDCPCAKPVTQEAAEEDQLCTDRVLTTPQSRIK